MVRDDQIAAWQQSYAGATPDVQKEMVRTQFNGWMAAVDLRIKMADQAAEIERLRSLVTWQPMDDCSISDDRVTMTLYGPLLHGLVDDDAVFIFVLPDGVRMCRQVETIVN